MSNMQCDECGKSIGFAGTESYNGSCWNCHKAQEALATAPSEQDGEVTDEQLRALRDEAGAAGDSDTVRDCTAALEGDDAARGRCASIIADAAMRAES